MQLKGSESSKTLFLRLLDIVVPVNDATDALVKAAPRIITIANRLILSSSQDSSLFAMSILRTIGEKSCSSNILKSIILPYSFLYLGLTLQLLPQIFSHIFRVTQLKYVMLY